MLVSFIVPTHNGEDTVRDCIESIAWLKRNCGIEIIAVNDGSTDETLAVLGGIPDIDIISVTRNHGVAHAINEGIKASKGDYIAVIEHDVILPVSWLQDIMMEFNHASIAAVAGYAKTLNKSLIGRLCGYDVEYRLDLCNRYVDQLYTMNTVYRRDVFYGVGMFNNTLPIAHDADMSRRLLMHRYDLVLSRQAYCWHRWRDSWRDYFRTQQGYAKARVLLARKGFDMTDDIVKWSMLLQVYCPVNPWEIVSIIRKQRTLIALLLPLMVVVRNIAWMSTFIKQCVKY